VGGFSAFLKGSDRAIADEVRREIADANSEVHDSDDDDDDENAHCKAFCLNTSS